MKKQINTQTPVVISTDADSRITVNGYTRDELSKMREDLIKSYTPIDIYTENDINEWLEFSKRMSFVQSAIEYIDFQYAAFNIFESVSLFAYDNPNDEDEETFPLGIGDGLVFTAIKKNGWCWVFADHENGIYDDNNNQPAYTFNADDIHDFNCKDFINWVAIADKSVKDKLNKTE